MNVTHQRFPSLCDEISAIQSPPTELNGHDLLESFHGFADWLANAPNIKHFRIDCTQFVDYDELPGGLESFLARAKLPLLEIATFSGYDVDFEDIETVVKHRAGTLKHLQVGSILRLDWSSVVGPDGALAIRLAQHGLITFKDDDNDYSIHMADLQPSG
jgi:hypothetical protein